MPAATSATASIGRRPPAVRLSQRVVAATFDGFHRSPSLAAPQPLLTNHADAAQRVESRRSVIARCTNVLTNEPSSRSLRHSILPCGAFSPTSAPRSRRGFGCAPFAAPTANEKAAPGDPAPECRLSENRLQRLSMPSFIDRAMSFALSMPRPFAIPSALKPRPSL